MILERLDWGDGGKGDAVGRNAFAYICWPNEQWLKGSILQCIKQRDDTYLQFYRYPNEGAETMSRDHVGAIILAFYINRDYKELDWILNNLPTRISRKYKQTLDFWLWQKSIKHRNTPKGTILGQLFLLLNIIMFSFMVPYNWVVRKILNVKPLGETNKPVQFPKGSFKYKLQKTIYPHFALFLLAWQVKVVKGSILKKILQSILRFDSKNVVIDAILNKPIPPDYQYKPTTSFIWSRPMDTTDDIYIVPNKPEDNDINKGMLDYLKLNIDHIMLTYEGSIIEKIKHHQPIINY